MISYGSCMRVATIYYAYVHAVLKEVGEPLHLALEEQANCALARALLEIDPAINTCSNPFALSLTISRCLSLSRCISLSRSRSLFLAVSVSRSLAVSVCLSLSLSLLIQL